MHNDYGMIEPDFRESYLSIPEFQRAVRRQSRQSVSTTPMPKDWIPAYDTTIWRFMDFFKFMSLVNDGILYFTRLDRLEDDHEANWSDATTKLIGEETPSIIQDEGWRFRISDNITGQSLLIPLVQKPVDPNLQDVLDTVHTKPDDWGYFETPFDLKYLHHRPTGHRFGVKEAHVVHQLCDIQSSLNVIRDRRHHSKVHSRYTLVNCWHINTHESDAMWSRYTDRKNSIAIKTDVVSLVGSFVNRYPNSIGKIQYIDFEKDVMPVSPFGTSHWFKRVQFQADCELRVVMDETIYSSITEHTRTPDYSRDVCDVGLPYKVNPKVLIHQIVVGPSTDDWVVELIKSAAKKYGIDAPVIPSSLQK